MRFSASLCTVTAFAASVFALENPISYPTTEVIAGKENTIKWTSTTPGKVTLYLKQGNPEDLKTVSTIGTVEGSTGMLTWEPPTSLPPGSDYAIQIVSETNEPNYTSLLTLNASGDKSSASASSSSTDDSSSASSTASATSHPYNYHSTMVTAPVPTGTGSPYPYPYGHNATYHNNTSARRPYSKSSSTSSGSSSSETASPTSSQSTEKISAIPPSPSDSGAMGLVRSPLAFVICVFGAIIYLN